MSDISANNKRIAKNTLLLYFRTILVMVISLYTSRVVLDTLGVEDFGIYNVVGGVVAMFGIISGSLSSAISRFITFELGRGDKEKLKRIFSTSVNIQLGLSLIIIILGETIGLWFLNSKMNIPPERMSAANWVLHCSLLTFAINLVSIPYNAVIIAHERMSVFAYVSILEVSLKLIIVYLLYVSLWDKLITYSILLVAVAACIRLVYGIYCNRYFEETKYKAVYDKSLLKEMSGFAGWSFLNNAGYLLNTQGVNILINLFFGVGMNAARGIATQVDGAIMRFVNNFTTALNPQIIKNYANGNMPTVFNLVCKGAKFSYYLLLFFAIPFLCETETILSLWLKDVPSHTSIFLRLAVIASMMNILGNTQWTACYATGNIRFYTLVITPVGLLVFPLTYLCYYYGMPVESTYYLFIINYLVLDFIRLFLLKRIMSFPIMLYLREVFGFIIPVTIMSVILSVGISCILPENRWRFILSVMSSLLFVFLSILSLGLTNEERKALFRSLKHRGLKVKKHIV